MTDSVSLLARVNSDGDKEALNALLARVETRIRPRLFNGRAAPGAWSEADVKQHVLLDTFKKLEKGEVRSTEHLWRLVRHLTRAVVINLSRRYSAAKRQPPTLTVEQPTTDTSADAYSRCVSREELTRVRACIGRLPQHLRTVVDARLRGKSFCAIGDAQGISGEGARKRWNQATEQLERLYANQRAIDGAEMRSNDQGGRA